MRRLFGHTILVVCLSVLTPLMSQGGEILRFPDDPARGTAPLIAPSGTDIRFVLSGNPQGGHAWKGVSSQEMVATPLPSQNRYIPEGADGKQGGKFHLLFRTGMPGKSVISLLYGREGEEPLRRHTIEVTVPAVFDPETLFGSLDRSGDGIISREEFVASPSIPLKTDLSGNVLIPVVDADTDGNGTISFAELKELMFRRLDRDGSGSVSREEFFQQMGTAFINFSP